MMFRKHKKLVHIIRLQEELINLLSFYYTKDRKSLGIEKWYDSLLAKLSELKKELNL